MDAPQHRFQALDGWRGICALLIALHHFPAQGAIWHLPLVRNAWLLVDFFFVLSGFVITHAYRDRLADFAQARSFGVRRFFRLWPLHIAVLAGFVLLELYRYIATGSGFTGERSIFALFTNIALIQALGFHTMLTWNTPAWAVSTEFWTYIIFALVVMLAARWRIVVSILAVAVSIALLAFCSRYGMRETVGWGLARCVYGFFLGSLTYELWSRARRRMNGIAEAAVLLLAFAYLVFVPGNRPLEYLAPPVFALFVIVFASDSGLLSRIMAVPFLQKLGQWSYAIYLVQMLVIVLTVSALDSFAPGHTGAGPAGVEYIRLGRGDDAITLAYLAIVIALAALGWRFIEVPGQRIANKIDSTPSHKASIR
ncbi:MAG TPA: acyltransferase [Rhizomicrobium sp.]|nr:acyltransferase [Rhizomicrobium sp.]